MSQMAPRTASPSIGRATPRWSVAGQPALAPASMAGLPARSACVWVVPGGLRARGPRRGLVLLRSPLPPKAQVASLLRLLPLEVMVPEQFPPEVLLATMVFFKFKAPPALAMPPPLPLPAEL